MRFHPVISIFLGIIAIFVLAGISGSKFFTSTSVLWDIFFTLIVLIFIAGGFIATYFTKDMRIRYGFYVGIILSVLAVTIGVIGRNLIGYKGTALAVSMFLGISLITGIGGFIGKMTDKSNRQSFKTKLFNNGFSPISAIIAGIIIAYVCAGLLDFVTGIKSSFTTYGVIDFVVGAISIAIGAIVTTFLAKEQKIQYGIYSGIIVIIISILTHGLNIHESYYIRVGAAAGYLLSAGVGGYLGIIVAKHLKQNTTKPED